ncbi:restriction endonuclease subunit S [Shewanella oncorhynchi]|uniref:restriction endonuclease subunit S n=1 Tax=Shewanella oncorhynchi TaxID=2726434 RepID=UPI003D7AE8E4
MADISTSTRDGQFEQTAQSLITQHIDIWTTAIEQKSSAGRGTSNKFSLYGIKKLRELILELAVRGKLVPQDPNDEPASVLLERIAADKAQLVKEGKLKKQKPLPQISEDEKPFELPQGWKWSRLNDVYDVRDGTHSTPKYQDSGYPLVTSKNLSSGRLDLSDVKFISEDDHIEIAQRSNVDKEDILFAMIGSIGNAVIVDTDIDFSIKNVALFKYYSRNLASPKYLLRFLSFAEIKFKLEASGAVQSFVSLGKVRSFIIALPPLEEQHRIVAKVDELMSLCDALEAQTEASISAHQTLVETLLNALLLPNTTQPEDSQSASTEPALIPSVAESFAQSWQRVAEHFDTLFTTEASIDTLKQTILQLAVMGKLVEQDPNDEPAAKLLERIAAEKAQLIKDGKIKKQKPLPAITDEEKPFVLPEGWEWCRIWDVAELITSGSRDWAKHYSETGAIFVTMGNLARADYRLRMDTVRYVNPPQGSEGARTRLIADDLLISITGDVGNLGLIPSNFGEAYINQHTCLLRFMSDCKNRYFPELMRSPLAKLQFDGPQRGIKNSFRLGDVGEMIIPLPPQEEQHRIVAKVDELMALCDQLKAHLTDAQTTQLHLTDAIVEQAI